jgi:2-methylisocitrate lyase-like PEP mutase family enzyme
VIETTQPERARLFLDLHRGPRILLLANAWDAVSARLFEEEGLPAIATTSAGVAFSLGFPDGERTPFGEMVAAIERIVRAVRIPVSADIESGFGQTAKEVGENVRTVLQAGAVGVNLEDGTGNKADPLTPISLHSERIRAAKETAASAGLAVVVNARTDVFLDSVGLPETRFDEAVARANAYRRAGADCLFVPAVTDFSTIERLVRAIEGPVNVLAGAQSPPLSELERLGVARVSLGSGPIRATLGLLRRITRELRDGGTYRALTEGALSYQETNELFARS